MFRRRVLLDDDVLLRGSSSPPSSSSAAATVRMPRLGLGTFQSRDDACVAAIRAAVEAGYRLIDTAACYRNHAAVARGLEASGVAREDIFLTSKIAPKDQGEAKAREAVLKMLEELGTAYVDLALIHWPGTQRKKADDPGNRERRTQTWLALEQLQREGACRAIGVSNYTVRHIKELLEDPRTTAVPAVNQVECHPRWPQEELRSFCSANGIHVQAYSSLGQGAADLLEDPTVQAIAAARNDAVATAAAGAAAGRGAGRGAGGAGAAGGKGKGQVGEGKLAGRRWTAATVLLKWALQKGMSVIPKSVNAERIRANAAAAAAAVVGVGGGGDGHGRSSSSSRGDLLTDSEMAALALLDRKKFAWDPESIR
eukprot:g390.t1